jgi:hypothetical protein
LFPPHKQHHFTSFRQKLRPFYTFSLPQKVRTPIVRTLHKQVEPEFVRTRITPAVGVLDGRVAGQTHRETTTLRNASSFNSCYLQDRDEKDDQKRRERHPGAVSLDALMTIPAYLRTFRAFASVATAVTIDLHDFLAFSHLSRSFTVFARAEPSHATDF